MLQSFREGIGRWLAIFILGLIALTFIFWGVDLNFYGSTYAARVNGEEISLVDFERDFQNQLNEYQQLFQQEITDEIQTQLRLSSLEELIRKEALSQRIKSEGYVVSSSKLVDSIRNMAIFQVGGEFSLDLYQSQLLNSGLSSAEFELLQREQLYLVELQSSIIGSGFNTQDEFIRYIELNDQTREISYSKFSVDNYINDPVISDIDIDQYYENNKDKFFTEESVNIEYLELIKNDLSIEPSVSEEALLSFYEDEAYRFTAEEERAASHILLDASIDNSFDIYEEVISRLDSGEDFGDLVLEFSQDNGTSDNGGYLGWITRNSLDTSFTDALFEMELGQISQLVQTSFGYHIIRLDDVRSGEIQTFEEVKDQLSVEYQNEQRESLFYDLALELTDLSFNAYDNLDTVADEMNIPLKTFFGLTRSGSSTPFVSSPDVARSAFSEIIVGQGINSNPIELSEDHVIVLRTTQFNQSSQRSLEAVKEEIRSELVLEEAKNLALSVANDFMTSANSENSNYESIANSLGGEWEERSWVGRESSILPNVVLSSLFDLPYSAENNISERIVTLDNGDIFVIYLSGVRYGQASSIPTEERNQLNAQLAEQSSLLEFEGYIDLVRMDSEVSIPDYVTDPSF